HLLPLHLLPEELPLLPPIGTRPSCAEGTYDRWRPGIQHTSAICVRGRRLRSVLLPLVVVHSLADPTRCRRIASHLHLVRREQHTTSRSDRCLPPDAAGPRTASGGGPNCQRTTRCPSCRRRSYRTARTIHQPSRHKVDACDIRSPRSGAPPR